ncbi:MAG TPA: bifunctional metallophosphatase/5'-nucleotidase [Actinophytocola sp.]|uniref:bifunctional metallophosphatase/5'-nucleotidase n=1 Tax=Actinophytocola sp. TaxID=1872138 RepID=UPI002DBFD501|nr:bifunctional metallophosphatase/5'-nucleotidase [Actinophytocola sp.]HEU5473288.1 bifunctional metallophosphatase/5'-nucleotidase [Actinophytocola sp.]
MSPVLVNYSTGHGGVAKGRVLSFNDFHGALEPPIGSGGLVNGTPAGGVEYLATHVQRLRAAGEAAGEKVITAGAGDLVGATPLISAAFHDEPSIETLSNLGLQVTSVGNHEFDEGVTELKRLQRGGCHPVDGCQDGDGFAGADFTYLSANVVDKRTRLPILAPVDIRIVQGVPVAFVGMTLEGTPTIVNPAGIQNVEFLDEVQTANSYAQLLRLLGIKSMVLLVHEGGQQNPPPPVQDPSDCANFTGPIAQIVAGLRPEYGLVVSGHTHRFYSCALPNSSGANSVVTSAGSNGTLITDIGFTLDRRTRQFASISARNVIVENGVRLPDGSWARDASGNFIRNPDLVDASTRTIVDKYRTAVAPIANRVVGAVTGDISRAATPAGESALGDVIADAQLAYTASAGAQIALMNPGGIRADFSFAFSPGGEAPGQVTYGEAFTVQPFNNLVVTQTFTGAQLKEVLEQQFVGFGGQTVQRILQPSVGFGYVWDSTRTPGDKVSGMTLNGVPIDPAATYRVTTNDFLANGGDGFTRLTAGTDRVTAPGFDIDALVAHLGSGAPVAPGPRDRIRLPA